MFIIKIVGDFYCCCSRNFEIDKIILDDYKIDGMSKEQVRELLLGDEIGKTVEESIKGSMIDRDPIAIVEVLWNEF